jgi:hypothetical protein
MTGPICPPVPRMHALPPLVSFTGTDRFEAYNKAAAFCRRAGFSIASTCKGDPTAIMFGDWLVAKWRNLSQFERAGVHGAIQGNRQTGPVTAILTGRCPLEGQIAFAAEASATYP